MNLHLPAPLRLPAALFVASLLLGSSVFYLALDTRNASKDRQIIAQSEAERSTRELTSTPERLAQDHAQSSTYTHLQTVGFLGDEDRLNWLGSLARIRTSLELQQISWRLSPREASDLNPGLYRSSMSLEISPANAHRLEQFLEQLRTLAHGHFTVHHCTLHPDTQGARGSASCTLEWWTWNDK